MFLGIFFRLLLLFGGNGEAGFLYFRSLKLEPESRIWALITSHKKWPAVFFSTIFRPSAAKFDSSYFIAGFVVEKKKSWGQTL